MGTFIIPNHLMDCILMWALVHLCHARPSAFVRPAGGDFRLEGAENWATGKKTRPDSRATQRITDVVTLFRQKEGDLMDFEH